MNTESGIPVTGLYADEAPSGYIESPTNTQFHSGVEPEMTLPAAWWNYFVNLFTNTNIKSKEDITAILAELNNALTTMGITPDPEASNQLATLFQNDVLPATFANEDMNANPYTTSSLVPKHRGNIAINTTTRTTWIATNTAAAAASWSRLWSPENDGSGSGLDADLLDGQHGNYYAPKSHASTTNNYGASSEANYGHAKASTVAGSANGTASKGSTPTVFAQSNHVHPLQTSVSGNAATATKLKTARTITISGDATGSTTFDGSANKTITLSVAKATKLATARTITIAGDATGSTTFDGSANRTITLSVAKATNATNAGYATNAGTAAACSGNAATATKATYATNAGTSAACSGNAATATNATWATDATHATYAFRTPNDYGSKLPAANAANHGRFYYYTSGGSGAGLYYCAQTGSSYYSWIKIGE